MSSQSATRNPQPAILIGGSIAIDHIKTPTAEAANLLGGSASYAALAASCYTRAVHMLGIVGKDFPAEHLDLLGSRGIDLSGIERSEGETFSWSGEYHENMNDRTTRQVAVNVLEDWQVKVPDTARSAPLVVLANMAPDNQLQLLDQLDEPTGGHRFVLADTMDLWISIANERLHEVLRRIDLLVINESEAREFVETPNLMVAGQRLLAKGPRHVVIKLGEFGAILFSNCGLQNAGCGVTGTAPGSAATDPIPQSAIRNPQLFRCAAFPLHEVTDPTGAGDSFLGALAGHLAASGATQPTFADLRAAVVQGSVVASFTCEAFSTRRLQSLATGDIDARIDVLKEITHWP